MDLIDTTILWYFDKTQFNRSTHLTYDKTSLHHFDVTYFVRSTAGPPYSVRTAAIYLNPAHVQIRAWQWELSEGIRLCIKTGNFVRIDFAEPNQISCRIHID